MRNAWSCVSVICGSVVATMACAGGPAAPAAGAPPTAAPVASAATASARIGAAPAAVPATPAPTFVLRAARTQGLGNVMQLADTRGYFQEQAIDFRVEPFASAADALPALSQGDLEVASAPPLPSFFNALAREIRLVLALDAAHLAPGKRGYPVLTRLAERQPVVQDLTDLRGKRVAHPARGNPAEPALERLLAEAGLQQADLQDVQYMGFPEILAAFGGGSMDVAIVPEPWGALAEDRGLGARVRDAGDYIPNAQISMIVFSERLARERPDAARRFAVAYLRAVRVYMDAMEGGPEREAVIRTLSESAGIDPRVGEKAGYLAIRRDGRINRETLTSFLDWQWEHGYVPQKPDLASLLDYQFADYAAATLEGTR